MLQDRQSAKKNSVSFLKDTFYNFHTKNTYSFIVNDIKASLFVKVFIKSFLAFNNKKFLHYARKFLWFIIHSWENEYTNNTKYSVSRIRNKFVHTRFVYTSQSLGYMAYTHFKVLPTFPCFHVDFLMLPSLDCGYGRRFHLHRFVKQYFGAFFLFALSFCIFRSFVVIKYRSKVDSWKIY